MNVSANQPVCSVGHISKTGWQDNSSASIFCVYWIGYSNCVVGSHWSYFGHALTRYHQGSITIWIEKINEQEPYPGEQPQEGCWTKDISSQ
jgi:hypothetical protein